MTKLYCIMENPFEENKPKRPTFLTVLCILTFIGSGWGVISNLFALFTAGLMNSNVQMQQYSSMMGDMSNEGGSAFLSQMADSVMSVLQANAMHAHEIAAIGLVLSLISVVGAILMFQLRRLGFYLYTAAQILMLFVLPYFAGFSLYVIIMMAISGFITLLFIILYAIHLKYMHRV